MILVKNSSNAEIDRKEYVWDEASRVTSAKEGGYWSYYTYDEIDQLTEEEKPGLSYLATYTYDNNGNRLTRTVNSVTETYTYDEADKLLDISVNSSVVKEYTYDAAGRTTAIEANSQTTTFAYDYEGRITSITYPNTSSDTYAYNGLGARTSTSGTNGSRSFFRNGLGVTSPVLGDGTADYTPGVSRTESTTTTFAHAGLKNTSTQTAENETVAATKDYDAFGNTVSSSGSWSGPFAYGDHFGYHKDGSALTLLGYRYYDSATGRFMTADPMGAGLNWYKYADNNPVTNADPMGLDAAAIEKKAREIVKNAESIEAYKAQWPKKNWPDNKGGLTYKWTDCGVFASTAAREHDASFPTSGTGRVARVSEAVWLQTRLGAIADRFRPFATHRQRPTLDQTCLVPVCELVALSSRL